VIAGNNSNAESHAFGHGFFVAAATPAAWRNEAAPTYTEGVFLTAHSEVRNYNRSAHIREGIS
jgi:hypothetical protein